MFRFLSDMIGGKVRHSHAKAAAKQTAKLNVEQLETRLVPTAVMHASIDSLGYLNITGTSERDVVSVTYNNQYCTVTGSTYHANTGGTEGWVTQRFNMSDLFQKQINFHGLAGDDKFAFSLIPTAANATHLRLVAYGGAGNDTLIGGPLNDLLIGSSGNDRLTGGAGDDLIIGEVGDDILIGGAGNDNMGGGDGNDQLFGGIGSDILGGDAGNDILKGESGNDTLFGGLGFDKLYGGWGRDTLNGGADGIKDYLVGGYGADKFQGEWYQDSATAFFLYKNRDVPADLHRYEGDSVDSPYLELQLLSPIRA